MSKKDFTRIYKKVFYINSALTADTPLDQARLHEMAALCESECSAILRVIRADFNASVSSNPQSLFHPPSAAVAAAAAPDMLDIKQSIKKTAAYILLMDWLFEFYKNMVTAGATRFCIAFFVAADHKNVFVKIADNGKTRIKDEQLGWYDLFRAINHAAAAIADARQQQKRPMSLSGANLGLAIATHFLRAYGEGNLLLQHRSDSNSDTAAGACLTLFSSMKPSRQEYVLIPGENTVQIIVQFLLQKTNIEDTDTVQLRQHKESFQRNYCFFMTIFEHASCSVRLTDPDVRTLDFNPSKPPKVADNTTLSERIRARSKKYYDDLEATDPVRFTQLVEIIEFQNDVISGRREPPCTTVWNPCENYFVPYRTMFPSLGPSHK